MKLNMKFGYTLIYVPNVEASLSFFEKAFGFTRRFLHESGGYGELNTGETTLAFASHEIFGVTNFPSGYVAASSSKQPLGIEVVFVTTKVAEAYAHAISVGATSVNKPESKPWEQVVAHVRCPDGTLVELCSPVGG